MADGSVTINVDADAKAAQQRLNALNRSIQKLQNDINKNQNARNPIVEQLREAQQQAIETYNRIEQLKKALAQSESRTGPNANLADPETFANEIENQKQIRAEIAQQEKLLAKQEAAAQKLEEKDGEILSKLEEQTAELEKQKEEAGSLMSELTQAGEPGGNNKLKDAFSGASDSINRGFKNILKWGFGIRSLFILVRRLKAYIKEAVMAFAENDPETAARLNELRASLAALKASWGAAFGPIVSAVIPVLNTLVGWLTSAANAVAMFLAVLGGKTSFKKAVSNVDGLSKSLGGAGGAAADAKKELMGIDELNIMSDNSGGGGGGGGANGYDWIEEAIDANSFGAQLAMSIKDVLFDWSELTPEQIAEKCFAALPTVAGMVIGGIVGGVPGMLIGGLVGLTLGILSDAIIFDHDGVLSQDEIFSMIQAALLAMGFGAIGLMLGGPLGAALGATIGLGLSLAITVGFQDNENPVFSFINKYLSDQAIIGFFKRVLNWDNIKRFIWDDGILWIVNEILSLFGTSIDNLGTTMTTKFDNFINKLKEKFNALKEWWSNIKVPQFHINMPHLEVGYEPTDSLVARFFGVSALPKLRVSWYAKGGIVDGATLIGAGEAGKEAIIPLERNTGWINSIAEKLKAMLFDGGELSNIVLPLRSIAIAADNIAAAMGNITLPQSAVASGVIVPPSYSVGGYDEVMDKLGAFLDRFSVDSGYSPIEVTSKVYLDKRQIGEAVSSYQRDQERSRGR